MVSRGNRKLVWTLEVMDIQLRVFSRAGFPEKFLERNQKHLCQSRDLGFSW